MLTAAPEWDWSAFVGSAEALKYNRRDLPLIDTVLRLVPGRTAVVQAGGNLGIFPKRLAQEFATVYTFEPAADCFAALQANAPEPNILKFQAALGAERQLVATSRVRRDGKPNCHEGITHIAGAGVVPTLRLDDLALPVCDLVMLDVEGWELYALRGAVETLARCRPVLVVENNKNAAFVGLTCEAIRSEIISYGYRFAGRLRSDDLYLPAESVA